MPHTYLEGVVFALSLLPPIAGVLTVALGVWLTFRAWRDSARTVRAHVADVLFRRRYARAQRRIAAEAAERAARAKHPAGRFTVGEDGPPVTVPRPTNRVL